MPERKLLALTAALAVGLAAGLAGCDAVRSVFAHAGSDDPGAADAGSASAAPLEAAALDSAPAGGASAPAPGPSAPAPGPSAPAPGASAPAPGSDPVPVLGERTVQFPASIQSMAESIFRGLDVSRLADASVPVLAPQGASQGQAQELLERYRATPDGYLARWSLENYDVVMKGTRIFASPPPEAGAPPSVPTGETQVSESETGMSASFSRFGADYSVQLVCRGPGGEGGSGCVTEADARALVDSLVPVGGGGK